MLASTVAGTATAAKVAVAAATVRGLAKTAAGAAARGLGVGAALAGIDEATKGVSKRSTTWTDPLTFPAAAAAAATESVNLATFLAELDKIETAMAPAAQPPPPGTKRSAAARALSILIRLIRPLGHLCTLHKPEGRAATDIILESVGVSCPLQYVNMANQQTLAIVNHRLQADFKGKVPAPFVWRVDNPEIPLHTVPFLVLKDRALRLNRQWIRHTATMARPLSYLARDMSSKYANGLPPPTTKRPTTRYSPKRRVSYQRKHGTHCSTARFETNS